MIGALRAKYPVPLEARDLIEDTNITNFDSCTSYAYQLKQPHAYTSKNAFTECLTTCRLYTETLKQPNAKSYTTRYEDYFNNTTRNGVYFIYVFVHVQWKLKETS